MRVDVLIVEDDVVLRGVVRDVLADEGLRVAVAANGREALERIAASRPAVVLLDLDLPVLDGLSVARLLRLRRMDVPVVLMTGAWNARQLAEEVHARGWLLKPFGIDQVLAAVRPFVRRAPASGQGATNSAIRPEMCSQP